MPEPAVWVAGVGSRQTPTPYLTVIYKLAGSIAGRGVGIASGNAVGSDQAWEAGAEAVQGMVRRYTAGPKRGVDCISIGSLPPQVVETATAIAREHHPAWHRLDAGGRRLMARNVLIVLGAELDAPVAGVACWAPGSSIRGGRVASVAGGTGLAVRLAAARGIPVLNLALDPHLDHARAWHQDAHAPVAALFELSVLA